MSNDSQGHTRSPQDDLFGCVDAHCSSLSFLADTGLVKELDGDAGRGATGVPD